MSHELPPTDQLRMLTPLLNNLYWVHRDIVAALAHAIPQRSDTDVVWLSAQLAREAAEVPQYRSLLDRIGFVPTEEIRINDSKVRYAALKETNDPVALAIGMNVVAQGTLGIIEHELLYQSFPHFLSFFPTVIMGMREDLDIAIEYLDDQPHDEVAAEARRLWLHLHNVTAPELLPLLEPIIAAGIFPADIVDRSIDRFVEICGRLRIDRNDLDRA